MATANRNDLYVLREVVKKLIPLFVQRNIKVKQMGTETYVRADTCKNQPVSINIPAINDDADTDFVHAIQGGLCHEVTHVLPTDFSLYGCAPRRSSKKSPQSPENDLATCPISWKTALSCLNSNVSQAMPCRSLPPCSQLPPMRATFFP